MKTLLTILFLVSSVHAEVEVLLIDPRTKSPAKVTRFNEIVVSESTPFIPARNVGNRLRFFSGLLGTTNIAAGTLNMNVDGSSTQQIFQVLASTTNFDIHIMGFLIYLQDGSISHSGFGALAALTNGISVFVIEGGDRTFFIRDAKTFSDLIQQTLVSAPFGDASRAFELDAVSGNEDAMVLPMKIGAIIPGGIRLGRGTSDRFIATVDDDLTALTELSVRVVGYRHFE